MGAHTFIFAGLLVAGLSAPAFAGELRSVDPWAPDELAGAEPHAESIRWVDPWAGDEVPGDAADLTGSVDTAGFTGGVGATRTVVFVSNGFYFNPSLPAGQAAMTGDRARPVHPLGRPRF